MPATAAALRYAHGFEARGLVRAVGIARNQKFYDPDVQLVPLGGQARKPIQDQEPREAEAALAALPWQRVVWLQSTKGPLATRFAMTRVRVGDGSVWGNNCHLPGDEVWLAGEWRASGERKYYLLSLPPPTPQRALAGTIKARWVREQAHLQLEEESQPGLLPSPVLDRVSPAHADGVHRPRLP